MIRIFSGRFVAFLSYKNLFNMERIIANNNLAEQTIQALKHEAEAAKNELISRKLRELEKENAELRVLVEKAKGELVGLEVANGKKQIPVPGNTVVNGAEPPKTVPKSTPAPAEQAQTANKQAQIDTKDNKKIKEKKPKQEKPTAGPTEEPPIDIRRLDLRVGKIIEVSKHPDADALYLEKIDCGEPNPRTVISGLVKFVPIEEMQNRMVVVLCNLKPVKMRGILSEAMVMCASTPDKVEVLSPPNGSAPGDLVHCDGYPREPDAQMNPKKKVFETVAPDLMTNDQLQACWKGAKLEVPGKGPIVAKTLKNVHVK